jgi:hypothetical protein
MKILTGNDLRTGAVTWWNGTGWSLFVDDAVDVGEEAEEILAREVAARRGCRHRGLRRPKLVRHPKSILGLRQNYHTQKDKTGSLNSTTLLLEREMECVCV